MSTTVHPEPKVSETLREALLGEQGENLCRLLREVYLAVENNGHYESDGSGEGSGVMLAWAQELGLIEPHKDGQFRLSAIGYQLGNVSKEYCNWIDEGRRLPQGVAVDDVRDKRVLDVGCGFGRHLFAYAAAGARDVWGVEPQESYRQAGAILAERENFPAQTILPGTATELPLGDEQFDLLVCRLVLTHVPDVRKALREYRRVLAPKGRVILVYPLFAGLCELLAGSVRRRNWRSVGWYGFATLNTLCMQVTGRQLRIRKPGRMHSVHSPNFPTAGWVLRTLSACGFQVEEPHRNRQGDATFKAVRR